MNASTLLSLFTVLAATASAQVKTPAPPPPLPKQPNNTPVYVPAPTGTQLLVVGGSDDCSTAAANDAISGAGTFAMSNVGATNGAPDSTGCVNTQLDVWFFWTSTQAGTARLQFCGQTTADTVVSIWADNNGGACPSGTAVACNDDSCGLQSMVLWPTTAGQTFFFQIGAFGAATTYSANFVVDYLPPPPANDDCSAAVVVSGVGTFPVDNNSATTSALTPTCGAVNTDVWFYWVAPQTGIARVSTCGATTANTKMAAWLDNSGGACPSGTSVACDDNFCGNQSRMSWPVTAGQAYFFQIGAAVANAFYAATFTIDYAPPPPTNDDCATPIALPAGDGTYAYDSTLATTGAEGQTESLCLDFASMSVYKDLWYTWTPTSSGPVTFTTCGLMVLPSAAADTRIAAYDGSGCPIAAALACNDDAGHSATSTTYTCNPNIRNSTLTFNAVCGQTYTLQVGQFASTGDIAGAFQLIETPGNPCAQLPTPFCFGDGLLSDHTTPCPCVNNGATGNGCANSVNAAGANLTTTGSPALDNVVLHGSGMPGSVTCIYLQGDALDDAAFGDGVRCVGGVLLRLRAKLNSGGASSFPDSTDTVTLSLRGGVTVGSGVVRQYQTYYRNSAVAFCPPETFNVTNGMRITW